jgi:hypothetical protein
MSSKQRAACSNHAGGDFVQCRFPLPLRGPLSHNSNRHSGREACIRLVSLGLRLPFPAKDKVQFSSDATKNVASGSLPERIVVLTTPFYRNEGTFSVYCGSMDGRQGATGSPAPTGPYRCTGLAAKRAYAYDPK